MSRPLRRPEGRVEERRDALLVLGSCLADRGRVTDVGQVPDLDRPVAGRGRTPRRTDGRRIIGSDVPPLPAPGAPLVSPAAEAPACARAGSWRARRTPPCRGRCASPSG